MNPTEIVVIAPRGLSAERSATTLFNRLRGLGADIAKVTTAHDELDSLTAEVQAALQRRPGLLLLIGGEADTVGAAVGVATDRATEDFVPEGAVGLESGAGFAMLLACTYLIRLPGDSDGFEQAWSGGVAKCLAEWLGRPAHVEGHLVILDAQARAVEELLANLADQHPEAYLRAEPADEPGAVRVCALACSEAEAAEDVVDLALAAVERTAVAARMRVASTGRRPASRIEPPRATGP